MVWGCAVAIPRKHEQTRRILVVDPVAQRRQMLSGVIILDGYDAYEAGSLLDSRKVIRHDLPHAIVFVENIPCRDILRLRQWYRGVILAISVSADTSLVKVLECGADVLITEPVRIKEVLARLRACIRRVPAEASHMGTPVVSFGSLTVDFLDRFASMGSRNLRMTPTEFDILACLVANSDRVVTRRELLDAVWGRTRGNYTETLRVHIQHLRRALGASASSPAYIVTIPGIGYRFDSRAM